MAGLTFQYLEFLGMNKWQRDLKGRTVLHIAVEHGHIELIKHLLKQKDIDWHVKDQKMRTPMHEAVLRGNRDVCWILESSSEKSLLIDEDSEGQTPVDYAIKGKRSLALLKAFRRWQRMRHANGKVDVPRITRIVPFLTPSCVTLLIAFNIFYFESRMLIFFLNASLFLFAYVYALHPHRLWHISRAPNTGLLGWFIGSVTLSLLIYFTILLPKIWPDYLHTIFSLLMLPLFVFSLRRVYKDPGVSSDTRYDEDGNPMGIIDVVSAKIKGNDYCTRCKIVYPSRTKHCRLCNCCYKGLDHHCLFLMTCVAINNHGAFMALLFCTFFGQLSFVRGGLMHFWSLSQYNARKSYLELLGSEPLISVYFFINLLGLWWMTTLILFQIKIISEGGTTVFLPNGEIRKRIDCLHAAGTVGELTLAKRFHHLKQFIKYYYFPNDEERFSRLLDV
ncbi:putative ZDHHC-type palmitoyltransferase 6 isoform X2 [Xenia sp. Carnegie-2017]|uniref:putative ZDHHC-type palmitoyltransferase 6 isoform X2 n=1 Tax=Xenia sp. Carnegie-2017 TaxID=2897299 RepID=UPI001F04336F|nr:putative ZDHHC-type palmitoyltransferase 6 isoform X2 [Xenia sp. Carnegie-2017]